MVSHLQYSIRPASVAHLDARPTGDQEVASSIPAGSVTFFRAYLIIKYFLLSFPPIRAGVSFWRKNVHNTG